MAKKIELWNSNRALLSITSGTRFLFGGVAGALGYRIVRADATLDLELALFGFLILMLGIVEYVLRTVEPEGEDG